MKKTGQQKMGQRKWWIIGGGGVVLGVILIIALLLLAFIFSIMRPLQPLAAHWRILLGFDAPKNYLVLLQNDSELRPTGGFISAFAFVRLNNGIIEDMQIKDSYRLEELDSLSSAPLPFQKMLKDDPKFQGWYFRDANFSPDFSVSAQSAVTLFNEQMVEKEVTIDGVVAVNFSVLEDMADLVSGVKIDDKVITGDDLFIWSQYETKNIDKHNLEALKNRKNIMGELGKRLIRELLFSPSLYRQLVQTVRTHLDRKNVLLYFEDSEMQRIVKENNWGGVFYDSVTSNFVHINAANIGGRKADRYIQKNYEYHLSRNLEGEMKVHVIVTFNHHGTYNINSDLYKAYVRVFMPAGSRLIKNWGDYVDSEQGEEQGFEYGADYIEMLPGERRIVHYLYKLPTGLLSDSMDVQVIKQSGSDEHWDITFQVPSSVFLENSALETQFEIHENVAFWSGEIFNDTKFQLLGKPDTLPPLIVWQKFIGLDKIEINFSEEMEEKTVLKIENYKIEDLNYLTDATDALQVTDVEKIGNSIYLRVKGVSEAEGERYKLTISNVADLSGNRLQPDPMEITLVQRIQ